MAIFSTQPVPEVTPDFQHELHILPPVADAGEVLWFAYIDEPTKWHRALSEPAHLLLAAAEVLRKLLDYERGPQYPGRRTPNSMAGTVREVPNLKPRWAVRVTADCSEQDAEWTVELQDDSAWGASGYDLRELLARLGERITAVDIAPQPLLSSMPAPAAEAGKVVPIVPVSPFETAARDELATIEREIAKCERTIAAGQEEITKLTIRRRGLKAALAAYAKHV